jgi:hypothetical protein
VSNLLHRPHKAGRGRVCGEGLAGCQSRSPSTQGGRGQAIGCYRKRLTKSPQIKTPGQSPGKGDSTRFAARSVGALAKLRVTNQQIPSPGTGDSNTQIIRYCGYLSHHSIGLLVSRPRVLLPPVPGLVRISSLTRSMAKRLRYGRRSGCCRLQITKRMRETEERNGRHCTSNKTVPTF